MNIWEKLIQFGFEVVVFIVLVIVIVTMEAVVTSRNVKTGHKTVFMIIVSLAVAGVMGWLSWSNGSIPLCIFSIILGAAFLIGCIYGHRKDWGQNE